jgi:hypothetical protein
VDVEGEGTWKECFKASNVKLPENGYLGLTALTGGVSDLHDILSVSTYSLDDAAFSDSSSSSSSSHYAGKRKESSFLTNVLIFVIIAFVAYVIWVYYQSTKSQYSYKRF